MISEKLGSKLKSFGSVRLIEGTFYADDEAKYPHYEFEASDFLTSHNKADILGDGGFGLVRRCQHDRLGSVAVKCMSFGGSSSSIVNNIKEATSRVKLLVKLKHINIVQVYGITSWGRGCFGIVIEEVKCGDLRELMIEKMNIIDVSWKLRYSFIFQIAKALKYLHYHEPEKPHIHLDLKLENVLLTTDMEVKLADFGAMELAIATSMRTHTSITPSAQWTALYTAPERLLDSASKATCAMDSYSYSMVVYEIITRSEVFRDSPAHMGLLLGMIAHDGQKPNPKHVQEVERKLEASEESLNLEIFKTLKSIMERCWCFDPQHRLTMIEVYSLLGKFSNSKDLYNDDIKEDAKTVVNELFSSREVNEASHRVPLSSHFPPFVEVHQFTDGEEQTKRVLGATTDDLSLKMRTKVDPDEFVAIRNKKVWRFNTATKTLNEMPELAFNHWGGSLVSFGNEVFAISGGFTNEVEKMNVESSSSKWTGVAPTTERRFASGTAVCGDWIYIVGGSEEGNAVKSGEKLNPIQPLGQEEHNQWEAIPLMNCPRYGHALVENGNKLYAIGGQNKNGGLLSSMEYFDPATNEWTNLPDISMARGGIAAVSVENYIYIIGGSDVAYHVLSSVEKYDVNEREWSEVASLNVARYWHRVCVIKNKIFVVGGYTGALGKCTDVIEVLDLGAEDQSWEIVEEKDDLELVGGIAAF